MQGNKYQVKNIKLYQEKTLNIDQKRKKKVTGDLFSLNKQMTNLHIRFLIYVHTVVYSVKKMDDMGA